MQYTLFFRDLCTGGSCQLHRATPSAPKTPHDLTLAKVVPFDSLSTHLISIFKVSNQNTTPSCGRMTSPRQITRMEVPIFLAILYAMVRLVAPYAMIPLAMLYVMSPLAALCVTTLLAIVSSSSPPGAAGAVAMTVVQHTLA